MTRNLKRTLTLLATALLFALIFLTAFFISAAAQQQPSSAIVQAQSVVVATSETEKYVIIDVDKLDGSIVTITNTEGKTIIYNCTDWLNDSYAGTMEVYKTESFMGYGMASTMSFYVPQSASFTFTSDMPGIGITVSDNTAYTHASSDTAQTVVFKDHARAVEIQSEKFFDYRLFLSDREEIRFDTVNVYGSANGNASLTLNRDGSVTLNGVVADADLTINNTRYSIPNGYDQVLITGSAKKVEAYAADGTPIELQLIGPQPPQPLKWWEKLPTWLQWILRWVFFGWIWMK